MGARLGTERGDLGVIAFVCEQSEGRCVSTGPRSSSGDEGD